MSIQAHRAYLFNIFIFFYSAFLRIYFPIFLFQFTPHFCAFTFSVKTSLLDFV